MDAGVDGGFWSAVVGLVIGLGGLVLGWRKATSETTQNRIQSSAEMASQAFNAYSIMLGGLRTEVSALRVELASVQAENMALRGEVSQLRLELAMARTGPHLEEH